LFFKSAYPCKLDGTTWRQTHYELKAEGCTLVHSTFCYVQHKTTHLLNADGKAKG